MKPWTKAMTHEGRAIDADYWRMVEEFRRMKGWTITECAARYGIPLRTWQNWTEGSRKPSASVARLLYFALRSDL